MMHLNWVAVVCAAIIPLLTGFVWYNPKTFGTIWMNATGVTPEQGKAMNMPLVFGMTFLFGLFLAGALLPIVIHQMGYYSILMGNNDLANPDSEVSKAAKAFMDVNGSNFRTFKHGMFHGGMAGLFIALPVLGVNALFEGKGRAYILVNAGYWILTMGLMGGVVCAFA